ncbi:hypothetical protein ACFVTP_05795 [Streptomyces celluloflavus]|uniref:hypothetical protein n=1 Tax=Streptomyces celluloflavus TaxID=58344 RepID=UPI0036DA7A3D
MTRSRPRWRSLRKVLGRTPATRLFAVEALSTLALSVTTLLVTTPGHTRVPEWVQLSGLGVLLAMIGATVHTWRLTLPRGLMPSAHRTAAPGCATRRLREQAAAERRLRWLLLLYPAVLAALMPVPATWVGFWFTLSLLSTLGGILSIGFLLRTRLSTDGGGAGRIRGPR